MGAVQKLATVVIIGLVAMATIVTVYLADEPNRRGGAEARDSHLAIERGTDLYIQYCLQCHGPAGLGSSADEDPSRIGPALNQSHADPENVSVLFQSDDPAEQALAEDYINYMLTYGAPQSPLITEKVMPAFAQDLNVRQMNDVVYLLMNGDWDYVYNHAVEETGVAAAEETCAENPDDPVCEDIDAAPPVYPTPPADVDEEEGQVADDEEAADDNGAETEEEVAPGDTEDETGEVTDTVTADSPNSFDVDELTVAPGDTLEYVNDGGIFHDFVVDELGIDAEAEVGESTTFTIPEDAEPGEYEFYCSVPGHAEAGMVGTLIVEGE